MNADSPKRKNLGRGLNALFGEQDSAPVSEASAAARPVTISNRIPVEFLSPSPFQPRRHFDESALADLTASIAEKGVLQPIMVRSNAQKPGHFEIIAGERRWRAAQRAQVHEVPVQIVELTDVEVLEVALIENLQRQDLSPVEEARGYRRLLDEFGHTQEQLGAAVGKSRTHITNTMRLLTLPDAVLDLVEKGVMTAGQARPLIGRNDAAAIAKVIVKRGLSARQIERLAKGFGKHKHVASIAKDADTAALEQSLAQATGYNVNISFNGKGGTVSIAYATLEQLDDIVRRLSTGGKKASVEDELFPDDDGDESAVDALTGTDMPHGNPN
jgi:ParB family chromosome partitioning protein